MQIHETGDIDWQNPRWDVSDKQVEPQRLVD